MKKERKTYSKEFKLETIGLSETSGKSELQLERELGLSRGCLYNWWKQVERDGAQAFPGKGSLKKDDVYVRQLERELAVACEERDILKIRKAEADQNSSAARFVIKWDGSNHTSRLGYVKMGGSELSTVCEGCTGSQDKPAHLNENKMARTWMCGPFVLSTYQARYLHCLRQFCHEKNDYWACQDD